MRCVRSSPTVATGVTVRMRTKAARPASGWMNSRAPRRSSRAATSRSSRATWRKARWPIAFSRPTPRRSCRRLSCIVRFPPRRRTSCGAGSNKGLSTILTGPSSAPRRMRRPRSLIPLGPRIRSTPSSLTRPPKPASSPPSPPTEPPCSAALHSRSRDCLRRIPRSMPSCRISRRTPMSRGWMPCWLLPVSASISPWAGSTCQDTPIPGAIRATKPCSPGLGATGSSRPSMITSPTTSS